MKLCYRHYIRVFYYFWNLFKQDIYLSSTTKIMDKPLRKQKIIVSTKRERQYQHLVVVNLFINAVELYAQAKKVQFKAFQPCIMCRGRIDNVFIPFFPMENALPNSLINSKNFRKWNFISIIYITFKMWPSIFL